MHASSTRCDRDPVRRHASPGRFAAVALAAVLLAACQGNALNGGERIGGTAAADSAASAAPGAGDRFGRTVSTAESTKRAIYGGLGNQR